MSIILIISLWPNASSQRTGASGLQHDIAPVSPVSLQWNRYAFDFSMAVFDKNGRNTFQTPISSACSKRQEAKAFSMRPPVSIAALTSSPKDRNWCSDIEQAGLPKKVENSTNTEWKVGASS
jgi:hypothetical protein